MSYLRETESQRATRRAASQQRARLLEREKENSAHPAFVAGGKAAGAGTRSSSRPPSAPRQASENRRASRVPTPPPPAAAAATVRGGSRRNASRSPLSSKSFAVSSCFTSRAASGAAVKMSCVSRPTSVDRRASPVPPQVPSRAISTGSCAPHHLQSRSPSKTAAARVSGSRDPTPAPHEPLPLAGPVSNTVSPFLDASYAPPPPLQAAEEAAVVTSKYDGDALISSPTTRSATATRAFSPPPTPVAEQRGAGSRTAVEADLGPDKSENGGSREQEEAVQREPSPSRHDSHSVSAAPIGEPPRAPSPPRADTTSPSRIRALLSKSMSAITNAVTSMRGSGRAGEFASASTEAAAVRHASPRDTDSSPAMSLPQPPPPPPTPAQDDALLVEVSPMTEDAGASSIRRPARAGRSTGSGALTWARTPVPDLPSVAAASSPAATPADSAVAALGAEFDEAANANGATIVEGTEVVDERADVEASPLVQEKPKPMVAGEEGGEEKDSLDDDVEEEEEEEGEEEDDAAQEVTPSPAAKRKRGEGASPASGARGSGTIADRVRARSRPPVDYALDDKILKWYTTPRRASGRKHSRVAGGSATPAPTPAGVQMTPRGSARASSGRASVTLSLTPAPRARSSKAARPVMRAKTPGKGLLTPAPRGGARSSGSASPLISTAQTGGTAKRVTGTPAPRPASPSTPIIRTPPSPSQAKVRTAVPMAAKKAKAPAVGKKAAKAAPQRRIVSTPLKAAKKPVKIAKVAAKKPKKATGARKKK